MAHSHDTAIEQIKHIMETHNLSGYIILADENTISDFMHFDNAYGVEQTDDILTIQTVGNIKCVMLVINGIAESLSNTYSKLGEVYNVLCDVTSNKNMPNSSIH